MTLSTLSLPHDLSLRDFGGFKTWWASNVFSVEWGGCSLMDIHTHTQAAFVLCDRENVVCVYICILFMRRYWRICSCLINVVGKLLTFTYFSMKQLNFRNDSFSCVCLKHSVFNKLNIYNTKVRHPKMIMFDKHW